MDVTVRITRDGDIEVTIGDETGYSPDIIDDLTRRATQAALQTHNNLHTKTHATDGA